MMVYLGTVTVTAGNTSATKNHGLDTAPTVVQITPQDNLNGNDRWVEKDATKITIYLADADPFNNHGFYVKAA